MEAMRMAGFARQLVLHRVLGFADILDSATQAASVSVNTNLAYRKDRYLRAELAVGNTAGLLGLGLGGSLALQELPLTNVAVLRDGSNPDRLVTQTGHAFLPRTPETLLYDADGNLLRDGRWIYTWDAENRLVRVQSRPDTPQASWRRVEWQYDGLGRRIRQITSVWTNGTWQVTGDLKLISDPVLLGRHIAELNATNNLLVRSYVWGLDLSGTLDGAGGVGGLLWVTVHSGPSSGTHFCAYDGNGNVVGLVSASTGTETGRYEYAPFGEPIRVTGSASRTNPFRFSTKRTDDTTDLVLYEYRAYSPALGRWLSRDPIGEEGGDNLYSAFLNSAVEYVDADGLQPGKPKPAKKPKPPMLPNPINRAAFCAAMCAAKHGLGEWVGKIADHSYTCGAIKRWCEEHGTLPKIKDVITNDFAIGQDVWQKFFGCFVDCMGGPDYKIRAERGLGKIVCNDSTHSVDYEYSVLLIASVLNVEFTAHEEKVSRSCSGIYAFAYQTCCACK